VNSVRLQDAVKPAALIASSAAARRSSAGRRRRRAPPCRGVDQPALSSSTAGARPRARPRAPSSADEGSHRPEGEARVDLNHAIRSTLTIARNEYKYVADLETDLAPLPPVLCHAGDLNQAVLNLVVNAAHAIADAVKGSDRKGRIRVRTRVEGDSVVISVEDDGTGIPDAVRGRVFEPFFTTKECRARTGQGLAIARAVVVGKHGGEITFETAPGKGTTFFVRLPVDGASRSLEGAPA
jgi:signal transduction histidine kinase